MDTRKHREHKPNYSVLSSKNIDKRLDHHKQLQHVLDAYATRKQNLLFRKHALERQKAMNYQNEYDRVRGLLSQHVLRQFQGGERAGENFRIDKIRGESRRELERRLEELKTFGAK